MTLSKGYYCVIQYVPDLARAESVNIGVLLFVPERGFLDAIIARDQQRIRRFFGVSGGQLKILREFKKSFHERVKLERYNIQTIQQLEKFIATRANQIQLMDPRFVKVSESKKSLNELFEKLVASEIQSTATREQFPRKLRSRFETAGIQDRLRFDLEVTVPVFNRELKIPFGFQNGKFNLLHALSFEADSVERNFGKACKYSMEGRALEQHNVEEFGEVSFSVIGRFRSQENESVAIVKDAFRENNIRLITEHEIPALIDEIRRTGKPVSS